MVESMLRAADTARVFLPPPPSVLERTHRLDGAPIDNETLADHVAEILASDDDLTFFEVLTVAAFEIFAETKVDVAVVEVGMGVASTRPMWSSLPCGGDVHRP